MSAHSSGSSTRGETPGRTSRYHRAARSVAQDERDRRRISLTNVRRLTPPSALPLSAAGDEGWCQMALRSSSVESAMSQQMSVSDRQEI